MAGLATEGLQRHMFVFGHAPDEGQSAETLGSILLKLPLGKTLNKDFEAYNIFFNFFLNLSSLFVFAYSNSQG